MMKGKIRLTGGGNFIILSKEKKGPKSYYPDKAFKGVAAPVEDADCEFELSKSGIVIKILVKGKTYEKGMVGWDLINTSPTKGKKTGEHQTPVTVGTTSEGRGLFRLPADTSELIRGKEIDNFFLKHYVATTWKGSEVDKLQPDFKASYSNALPRPDLFTSRLLDSIKKLCGEEKKYKNGTVKTSSRLVVGLGTSTVYETGMTLHHIYGVPYLPGSALKGVCRSFVINSIFDSKEDRALEDTNFRKVFGAPKDTKLEEISGAIRFHDALPADEPTIRADIMNPHYNSYYNGTTPPADYIQPVPVPFLTVMDSSFQVAVSECRHSDEILYFGKKSGTALDLAWDFLKEALKEQGIGAKTSIGYGRLE
jgi:CRISPR-associated protein Cmr6